MQRFFEKYETLCCILLIVLYVMINSFSLQNFGVESLESVVINTLFSVLLILLSIALKRVKYYGLKRAGNDKRYLFFIPLIPIATVNLWGGIAVNNTNLEIFYYILTMINIGFIEEIIFRGFLFKMMEKGNLKIAITVNALTFGVGHIVNLFNGADLVPTLLQIFYATAVGFLFVCIFYRSKSIIPCIITHIFVNATSVFAVENSVLTFVTPIVTVIISVVYAVYILKLKNTESKT